MIYSLNSRTLQELVEHYSKDSDGLCVNLCKPCVQVSVSRGGCGDCNKLLIFMYKKKYKIDIK